jgi:hypothetical protein
MDAQGWPSGSCSTVPKCEAMSLNSRITKKKKKRERERKNERKVSIGQAE